MPPSMLRTAFGMACLCTFGAIALLLLEPSGSGPFWITVWTLIAALVFLFTVLFAIRISVHQRKGGDVSSTKRTGTSSR